MKKLLLSLGLLTSPMVVMATACDQAYFQSPYAISITQGTGAVTMMVRDPSNACFTHFIREDGRATLGYFAPTQRRDVFQAYTVSANGEKTLAKKEMIRTVGHHFVVDAFYHNAPKKVFDVYPVSQTQFDHFMKADEQKANHS